MQISFISEGDAANMLTEMSYCLNKYTDDIKSKSICKIPHPFNYDIPHDYNITQCSQSQLREVHKWISESDLVIINVESTQGSNYHIFDYIKAVFGIDLYASDKRIMLWYPGTNYRNNVEFYNNHIQRQRIEKHLYAVDLYRLSPKGDNDMVLLPYHNYEFNKQETIDKFLKKLYSDTKPIISHIPSSQFKGTNEIKACLSQFDLSDKYDVYLSTGLPHPKVMEIKNKTLFYIDQFYPRYGTFGMAALEGLIQGNFAFSSLNNVKPTMDVIYGPDFPIVDLGDNIDKMKEVFEEYFIKLSKEELEQRFYKIADWLEKNLDPHYIVKEFKEKVLAQ